MGERYAEWNNPDGSFPTEKDSNSFRPVPGDELEVTGHAPASDMSASQAGRLMMLSLDPLLRKLPYETRSAVLLNLLVTYAAELPAASQRRGKFINAMTEEFKKRLQMFLPIETGG